MKPSFRLRLSILTTILVLGLAVLATSAPALARHRVTFKSGHSLEIAGYRMEGGLLVLSLEGGGELGCPPAQIAGMEMLPEVPRLPAGPISNHESAPKPPDEGELHVSPGDPRPGVRTLVQKVASGLGLDPRLVEAVVRVESNYDPFAVSTRGAMGLMQLMPQTARRFQVENVFDPAENLEGGARYLKTLLERYGDLRLALAAYNAGESAVDRFGEVPPYRETRTYVGRILRILQP